MLTGFNDMEHQIMFLKGHCNEDFAVLGQFCAKIVISRLQS